MVHHIPESQMVWPWFAFQYQKRDADADPFLDGTCFVLAMRSVEYGPETGVVISSYLNEALIWVIDRQCFEVCEVSKNPFPDDPPFYKW